MKRTLRALVLATITLAWCGGSLRAQQPAPTRVAIVNVGMVFTKYSKAVAFKTQMEKSMEPYMLEGKKLKKEILDWTEAMRHPKFDLKEKDRYEQGIKGNQRKLEDLEMQVRKLIGKSQEEQTVALFKEVDAAIKGYAQANGIQMVLGYGEQLDGDLYAFPNISRKMQGMDLGGLNPIFCAPGLDISQQVVDTLNMAYQRAGGAAPTGVTPVSGTAPSTQK